MKARYFGRERCRRRVWAVVTGAATIGGVAVLGLTGVASAGVRPANPGGGAIEVPGLGALNVTGYVQEVLVSCASAGNCAVAGNYGNHSNLEEGFVAGERNGEWGKAIAVPGLAALNTAGGVQVFSVSCASAGNCAVGGSYLHFGSHGFVASQRNGVWGKAIEIPGLAALNTGRMAQVSAVSCALAGNCVAGGSYTDRSRRSQGFVDMQRHGTWGKAIKVPGLGALNAGRNAQVSTISCTSARNCAAAGNYADRSRHSQGFVATERNGTWGKAIEIPGLAALNAGLDAHVSSISCASAGNCVAGGSYADRSRHSQGFVATERNGTWGKAIEVPGLGALNSRGVQDVWVACASAGTCVAGGAYTDSFGDPQGFVASQRLGAWGKAIEVPGLRNLTAGSLVPSGAVLSVSCARAGNCAASGSYIDSSTRSQGFVARERNGVWGKATEISGLGRLNDDGNAQAWSVSCGSASDCVAAGTYENDAGLQGFVTS